MHSNNPSIVTEVPLVRCLLFDLVDAPNSAKVLEIPEPEEFEDDIIVNFLDSFTRE